MAYSELHQQLFIPTPSGTFVYNVSSFSTPQLLNRISGLYVGTSLLISLSVNEIPMVNISSMVQTVSTFIELENLHTIESQKDSITLVPFKTTKFFGAF